MEEITFDLIANLEIHQELILKDSDLDGHGKYKRTTQWIMRVSGGFIYYMRVSTRYLEGGCAEALTSTFVPY